MMGLALRLMANGCRYHYLRMTGKPAELRAISLEVTHRCICRCRMCNIWRLPNDIPDLDLSLWIGLLTAPELKGLREIDITGGEPFLREDLPDFLRWISRAKPASFRGLRTVAITTNGILSDRILRTVKDVVGPMRTMGIDLVLACGMDGVGVVHDQVRNFTGAWDRLCTTFAGLQRLRAEHTNLVLGIKTTIVPGNVNELQKISEFAREHDLFTIISPCIVTANRFANTDLAGDLCFDDAGRQAMMDFYRTPLFAWSGHRQMMLDYLAFGEVKKPCSAGFNTVFVRHNGEVFPCPVMSYPLGNFRQETLTEMLRGEKAKGFRRRIGSFSECRICTEPGLERLALPFEGFSCLRQMWALGPREFSTMADHMGLYKHL